MALPEVKQRHRAAGRGRQDRAAAVLRLGAERDRRQRPAGADRRHGHRRRDQRRTGWRYRGAEPSTQAVLRAAKRPPNCERTTRPGSTAARRSRSTAASTAAGTCSIPPTKRCCGAPKKPNRTCTTDTSTTRPKGAKLKAVRVNPGTVLVQAHPVETAAGKVTKPSPNSWYVLKDDPVLTGADITNPTQGNDESTGQPDVTFGFTSHGKGDLRTGHQGNRPPRPGSAAAGRLPRSGAAALRGRARRAADHRAVDRLQQVPGRDRRLHRALRSRAASRSPPRRTSPTSCSPARCRSS